MRFAIRDLLLFSTLVAIYCAMTISGVLGDLLELDVGTIVWLILIVGVYWMAGEERCRRTQENAGQKTVELRRRAPWPRIYLFTFVLAVVGGFEAWRAEPAGHGAPLAVVAMLTAAQLFLIERDKAGLHELGLVVGDSLWRFDESPLRVEETRSGHQLRPIEGGGGIRGWFANWPIIPPNRVDEVRAILAEKQGVEPPMDADKRG